MEICEEGLISSPPFPSTRTTHTSHTTPHTVHTTPDTTDKQPDTESDRHRQKDATDKRRKRGGGEPPPGMWTNDLHGPLRQREGDVKVSRDPRMCGVVFVQTKAPACFVTKSAITSAFIKEHKESRKIEWKLTVAHPWITELCMRGFDAFSQL